VGLLLLVAGVGVVSVMVFTVVGWLLFRMVLVLLLIVVVLLLDEIMVLPLLVVTSGFFAFLRTAGFLLGFTAAVVDTGLEVGAGVGVTIGAGVTCGCSVMLGRLMFMVGVAVVVALAAAAAAAACCAKCCCACFWISSAVGSRGVDRPNGGTAASALGSILMRIFGISVADSFPACEDVEDWGCGAGMVRVNGRPSLPFWFGMEIMMSPLLPAVAAPLPVVAWVWFAGSGSGASPVSRPIP